MLVEFSISNFLSFKERVTFSMVAASIHEHEEENTFFHNNLRLLKSASVYGANSSGKSNFIKAFKFVKTFVTKSSKETNVTEKIEVNNFKLSTITEKKPSFFEIIFYIEKILYRYNFEVTKDEVLTENLYFTPSRIETTLFERKKNDIKIGKNFKEGKGLEIRTRSNALFLSVVAQFNGEKAKSILEWFNNCQIVSGLEDTEYMSYTLELVSEEKNRRKVTEFIKKMDVNIQDINLNETVLSPETLPKDMPYELRKILLKKKESIKVFSFMSRHNKFDYKNNIVGCIDFDFDKYESDGTRKLLALAGLYLNSMKKPKILIIDEFDARLHSLLSINLIRLFNSKEINNKNSQLIFTTHDVKLMNNNLLRRDQIWFTSKNEFEATKLYSLIEYKKGIRNDEVFEKNYLDGRYGAIPYLKDIRESFNC